MSESRTRERALAEILRLLSDVRKEIADEQVREILSDNLVKEAFANAWGHQFDDDRTTAVRIFRELVREAIEQVGEA